MTGPIVQMPVVGVNPWFAGQQQGDVSALGEALSGVAAALRAQQQSQAEQAALAAQVQVQQQNAQLRAQELEVQREEVRLRQQEARERMQAQKLEAEAKQRGVAAFQRTKATSRITAAPSAALPAGMDVTVPQATPQQVAGQLDPQAYAAFEEMATQELRNQYLQAQIVKMLSGGEAGARPTRVVRSGNRNVLVDAQTGQEIRAFDPMPSGRVTLGGGGRATERQTAYRGLLRTMAPAREALVAMREIAPNFLQSLQQASRKPGGVSAALNTMQDANVQALLQQGRLFANGWRLFVSGQAATDAEYAEIMAQIIPTVGDKPLVKMMKELTRDQMFAAIEAAANPGGEAQSSADIMAEFRGRVDDIVQQGMDSKDAETRRAAQQIRAWFRTQISDASLLKQREAVQSRSRRPPVSVELPPGVDPANADAMQAILGGFNVVEDE